jgi:hypothetical protein
LPEKPIVSIPSVRVKVPPDLGGRRLPAQLAGVLRRLEELESPDVDRGEVFEHLGVPARERHERAEIRRVGRVVRAAEEPHGRRQAEPAARRDAEACRRIAYRELLYPEEAGRYRTPAPLADFA